MKNIHLSAIVLVLGIASSSIAMSENMSVAKYNFLKKNLDSEYMAALVRCNLLSQKAGVDCSAIAKKSKDLTNSYLQDDYSISVGSNNSEVNNIQKSILVDSYSSAIRKDYFSRRNMPIEI
jgi:hypothetical protein